MVLFSLGEQPLDHVAYIQWDKGEMVYKQSSLSGTALRGN